MGGSKDGVKPLGVDGYGTGKRVDYDRGVRFDAKGSDGKRAGNPEPPQKN
jgi:hypothetical protein